MGNHLLVFELNSVPAELNSCSSHTDYRESSKIIITLSGMLGG